MSTARRSTFPPSPRSFRSAARAKPPGRQRFGKDVGAQTTRGGAVPTNFLWARGTLAAMTSDLDRARYRARAAALRRTRAIVAGTVAGVVGLSGACSAMAALLSKAHAPRPAASGAAYPSRGLRLPAPDPAASIAGEPATL